MKNRVDGFAFRITGLILGIVGAVVSITGIVFSVIGLHRARVCKHCKMEGTYQ
ncbi:MAG: hypothetical protein IJ484_02580 [Oscillospiraceae bacterium]|nr:hypothetical protein [Oscillospiraceae bacterium]